MSGPMIASWFGDLTFEHIGFEQIGLELIALEQFVGIAIASTLLCSVGYVVVGLTRRQNAATRCSVWQAVSCAIIVSALLLWLVPGVPLRSAAVVQTTPPPIQLPSSESPLLSATCENNPLQQAALNTQKVASHKDVQPQETDGLAAFACPATEPEVSAVNNAPGPGATAWRPSVLSAMTAAWLFVAAIQVLLFVRNTIACYRAAARGSDDLPTPVSTAIERVGVRLAAEASASPSVRLSAEFSVPFTLGLVRPVIVLPVEAANWSTEKVEMVLAHELAHIERRDILWHWISKLACSVAWFNPLVWRAARSGILQRERACDDRVLAAGFAATDYGESLVEIATVMSQRTRGRSMLLAAGVSVAQPPLKQRLQWILAESCDRRTTSPRFRWAVAMTFLAVAMLLGVVRPLATKPAHAEEPVAAPPTDQVSKPRRSAETLADARARLTYSRVLRTVPYRAETYFSKVGALVKNGFWAKVLPLTAAQAEAITDLDDLVKAAHIHSLRSAADYLDGKPDDYRDYIARNKQRQAEAIEHAQQMVNLGLLTKPQSAFVTQKYLAVEQQLGSLNESYSSAQRKLRKRGKKQSKELREMTEDQLEEWTTQRYLSAERHLQSLGDQQMQKLLELTESQMKEFAKERAEHLKELADALVEAQAREKTREARRFNPALDLTKKFAEAQLRRKNGQASDFDPMAELTESANEKSAEIEKSVRDALLRLNRSQRALDVIVQDSHIDRVLSMADTMTKSILTQRQRDIYIWSQLTAVQPLSAALPATVSPDTEAANAELLKLSTIFRVIAGKADSLKLSAEQQRLLNSLQELTREGLLWIDARDNQVDQTRAEFLRHAEQVALLGILTERQATVVRFGC